MDGLGNLVAGENTALVIIAFLQTDCRNAEYDKELQCLHSDLTWDKNCNCPVINDHYYGDHGDLETDGHLPSNIAVCLDDIRPSLDLHRNPVEAAALQQVAEELRVIAAQLEHSVVAQATQNLRRNLLTTPSNQWRCHLKAEVEQLMRSLMSLEDLPQERVIMAFTLTLVKGVCEQTPRLLRYLFTTAFEYLTSLSWAR